MKQEMYEYFNAIEERHWWFRARKDIVLKMIDKYFDSPSTRAVRSGRAQVLDVGCGTGGMLRHLARYGEVWGLDPNEQALRYSRAKVPEAHLLAGKLPNTLPDKQFDLITCLDVLEHVDEEERAVKKLAETLKPDGLLVLTVPAYQWLWTAHDDINEHKRRYTTKELETTITNAGFSIQKISYYNTLLFVPAALAKLLTRLYPRKNKSHFSEKPPPAILNVPLRIIFSLEQYLLSHINFPFGVSIIVIAKKEPRG